MRWTAGLLSVSLAVGLGVVGSFAGSSDPESARKVLVPRSVTFSSATLPLPDAIKELSAATGNTVADRRRDKTGPAVHLPTGPNTFWRALDAIGKGSGIGFSSYLAEGGVALTDAPYRPMPIA